MGRAAGVLSQGSAAFSLGRLRRGSQRGWVRLTVAGSGCDYVADWAGVADLSESLDACTIRRIDLALDIFDGSAGHESILAAHESGRFKRFEGGRNPKMKKSKGAAKPTGEPFTSALVHPLALSAATKKAGSFAANSRKPSRRKTCAFFFLVLMIL